MTSYKRKTSLAFTMFVTAALMGTLSFHGLPEVQAQATALNPATTQIINQIASQIAGAQGADSAQVSQVLAADSCPDFTAVRPCRCDTVHSSDSFAGGNRRWCRPRLSSNNSDCAGSRRQARMLISLFCRLANK